MYNAYLRVIVFIEAVIAGLAARRRPALAGARGVTFIEYALLAAIAVGVSFIFKSQLKDIFDTLLAKVNSGLDNGSAH